MDLELVPHRLDGQVSHHGPFRLRLVRPAVFFFFCDRDHLDEQLVRRFDHVGRQCDLAQLPRNLRAGRGHEGEVVGVQVRRLAGVDAPRRCQSDGGENSRVSGEPTVHEIFPTRTGRSASSEQSTRSALGLQLFSLEQVAGANSGPGG